nr:MAG: glycoprotein [Yongjia Tick Virus 2]
MTGLLMLVLALTLCHGLNIYQEGGVLLPLSEDITWRHVKLDQVQCPFKGDQGPDEGQILEKWIVGRPRQRHDLKLNGYLCHKARWTTRCVYTWYFSKTVSRQIENLKVPDQDCASALKQQQEGQLPTGSFPPESCYWATTNDETVEAVTVTPHPVHYDPYTNEAVDTLFPNGRCGNLLCPTVYDSTVWMQGQNDLLEICSFKEDEPLEVVEGVKISGGMGIKVDLWITGPHLPHEKLLGICHKDFCGKSGLLTLSGTWFYLQQIVYKKNNSLDVLKHVPECNSTRLVGVLDEMEPYLQMRATLEEITWDMNCLATVDSIHHHNRASPHDLFQISPTHPGTGPIYRITSGGLEMGTAEYVVAEPERRPTRQCLGRYSTNTGKQCVGWKGWTQMENSTFHAFNGITERNGQIKLPKDRMATRDWGEEYIKKHPLSFYHHPSLGNLTRKITENILHKVIKSHNVNAGDLIGNWVTVVEDKVSSFFSHLGGSVVGLLSVILVVGVIYMLIQIIHKIRTPRPQFHSRDMELQKPTHSVFG